MILEGHLIQRSEMEEISFLAELVYLFGIVAINL